MGTQGIDEVALHRISQGTTRAHESSVCAGVYAASVCPSVETSPGNRFSFNTSQYSYFYLYYHDTWDSLNCILACLTHALVISVEWLLFGAKFTPYLYYLVPGQLHKPTFKR